MKSPITVPGPDETLAELAWLHPEIYRAFEHGVYEAKNHFETKQLKYDAAAFSTFVRLHGKDYLSKKGLEAVDVEDVNLTGLSLKLDAYHIKMWKASDDGLPVPGKSEPKQAFYEQSLFEDGECPEILNLAVIWNINASKDLSAVWLICPKHGDETSAEAYWNVRIPDPTLTVAPSNTTPPTDDLPIVPKDSKEDRKKKGNDE
jgi:hypothetical protein